MRTHIRMTRCMFGVDGAHRCQHHQGRRTKETRTHVTRDSDLVNSVLRVRWLNEIICCVVSLKHWFAACIGELGKERIATKQKAPGL